MAIAYIERLRLRYIQPAMVAADHAAAFPAPQLRGFRCVRLFAQQVDDEPDGEQDQDQTKAHKDKVSGFRGGGARVNVCLLPVFCVPAAFTSEYGAFQTREAP